MGTVATTSCLLSLVFLYPGMFPGMYPGICLLLPTVTVFASLRPANSFSELLLITRLLAMIVFYSNYQLIFSGYLEP